MSDPHTDPEARRLQVVVNLTDSATGGGDPPDSPVPAGAAQPDPKREITTQLVGYLEAVPAFSSSSGRDVLYEEIRSRLPYVVIPGNVPPRMEFASLARQCSRKVCGLAELALTVEFLAPGDPDGQEASRLAEELEALTRRPFLHPLWDELRGALSSIPLRESQPMLLHAASRVGKLPTYCDGTWSGFVHLFGVNPASGKVVPPWMVFLELVREWFDGDLGERTRGMISRQATTWGGTGELQRVRTGYRSQEPRSLKVAVLTIVVGPNPLGLDQFVLSTAERWEGDRVPMRTGPYKHVHRTELEAAVESAVRTAEEEWAAQSAELRVEFMAPLPLLNEPVEWWPKDSAAKPPTLLAVHHPIVLRSFERTHRSSWRRAWGVRWQRLNDKTAAKGVHTCDPGGDLRKLDGDLSDEELVVLVLGARPTDDTDQQITVAFGAGIPVILWDRGNRPPSELRELIADLRLDIARIPERLTTLRRESERLAPDKRDADPVRGIALLWDDADHVPHVGRGRVVAT